MFMNKKIIYIEDQNASTIQTELTNRGLDIEVISPSGFDETLQILNAKDFAAIIMDFRLTDGIGRVDAPTFASTFRTVGDNHKQVPMVLISNEENLPFFSQDFTSQDLFDFVISKDALRANYDKYSNRIKSLIDAYNSVSTVKFDTSKLLCIESIQNLDYRFLSILENFKKKTDIYGYIRTINNSLIRSIGALIGRDVLAARLGIDSECEDFQKLLQSEDFVKCKYKGILSSSYDRWWFSQIDSLWQTISTRPLRRTPANERVEILNQKFGLSLQVAAMLPKATSSLFWTICNFYKKPLDPFDGLRYNERKFDDWSEPMYISLYAALEQPQLRDYISPMDLYDVINFKN